MKPASRTSVIDRPVVRLPRQGIPGAAIATAALVAAILLFVVLNGQRRERQAGEVVSAGSAFNAPAPLALPPEVGPQVVVAAVSPPPIVTSTIPFPRSLAPSSVTFSTSPASAPVITATPSLSTQTAPSAPIETSPHQLTAPALVVDTAGDRSSSPDQPGPNNVLSGAQGLAQDNTPARATRISNRSNTVSIGTLIPIVLETPIDTTRPGLVRAVVSGDTRGFDGRQVLVPRGSRLIGEYQADVRASQDRVLVNWIRLVRPDGVTIRLASPAADELGGAGVPGRLHSYFLQRFASAVLQSALTVGVNIASRPRAGSVVVGLPTSPIQTLGQNILPGSDLRPKVTVKQGATLNVFVARDLDFSGAGLRQ